MQKKTIVTVILVMIEILSIIVGLLNLFQERTLFVQKIRQIELPTINEYHVAVKDELGVTDSLNVTTIRANNTKQQ